MFTWWALSNPSGFEPSATKSALPVPWRMAETPDSTILSSKEGIAWRKLHYAHAKLDSSTGSSIILAAFGMDVMSSYAFTYPSHVPSWLMTLLSVNTVLMISMHCFAFMVGTCLKPYLHAASKEYNSPSKVGGHLDGVPTFPPHLRFSGFIRLSYQISHVAGLFIFLLEIVLIAWVKFWDVSFKACVASTIVMAPFLLAFVAFLWYFHFSYKTQIYNSRRHVIDNVEQNYNKMNHQATEEDSPRHFTFNEGHAPEKPVRRTSTGHQNNF